MNDFQSWVPEFYYDLIARIVPGSLGTAVLVVGLSGTAFDRMADLGSALLLPLALVLSYVFGFFLDAATGTVFRVLLQPVRALSGRIQKGDLWRIEPWQVAREAKAELDATLLVKMLAERSMVRSISSIGLLAVVFDAAALGGTSRTARWLAIGLVVAFVCKAEIRARQAALRLAGPVAPHPTLSQTSMQ